MHTEKRMTPDGEYAFYADHENQTRVGQRGCGRPLTEPQPSPAPPAPPRPNPRT